MEDIVFNVKFEGESLAPEIFCLPAQTKWMDLEAMVKAQYDCEHVQIFYIDPEGDYVAFCSQEEFEEAIRISDSFSNTLHLVVRDLGPDSEPDRIVPRNIPSEPTTEKKQTEQPEDPKVTGHGTKVNDEGLNVDGQMSETIIHVDDATGETTETTRVEIPLETILEMMDTNAPQLQDVVDETGETTPLLPTISENKSRLADKKADKKIKTRKLTKESRRLTQSADRGAKPKKLTLDLESGESDEVAMPYSVFVKFMQQLKTELRTEIVKDVTKKTVRHVLKGLDGAVIQSVKGPNEVDPAVTSPTAFQGETTPKTEIPSSHPIYYHEGIICNFCDRVILGVRYKCCNCIDYDLCEECEAVNGIHNTDHVFLKLRKPAKFRLQAPLFKATLYRQREKLPQEELIQESITRDQVNRDCMTELLQTKFDKIQEKTARKQERLRRKEEKLLHKQRRKEELLKRRLDTQRDEPLKRERLEIPLRRHMGFDASLLYDVTIPDETKVQPGTKLLKTWRMKNTGSRTWNDCTKLHLVYGSFPSLNSNEDVKVLPLAPGDEADISVELIAPEKPGKYQSHWKMTQSGKQFGHRLLCMICVVPREVLEPTGEEPLKLDHVVVLNDVESKQQMEKSCEETEHFTDRKETEELLTVREEFVIKKEVDTKTEDKEVNDEDVKVEEVRDEDKVKLEQDLSTAAAAVAQLKLDQSQQPVTSEAGQDLMSFELLNLANRGSHKVSQTATPNNTPLDVTPPKSPAPELEDLKALSASSSVEVVNADVAEVNAEEDHLSGQYVRDIMDNLHAPKLDTDDVDIESLKSYTDDDDDSSLSEDDDFLIVPMPACFDFSKPVISRSIIDDLTDDEEEEDEDEEVDDNHNTISPRGSSVDELLATSEALPTQPLDPKPVDDNVNKQETLESESAEPPAVAATAAEVPQDVDPEETAVMTVYSSAAGAAGVYDDVSPNTGSGVSCGSEESEQRETTHTKKPVIVDVHPANGGVASDDRPENGATGENGTDQDSTGQHGVPPDMFVNQVMATAVKAANKAASNALTTCKEVFYTWQARTYQNGSRQPGQKYKPPQSSWKPKEEKFPAETQPEQATSQPGKTFIPPRSTWKPKEDQYKPPKTGWTPPQDKWMPPKDKWMPNAKASEQENSPMTKLFEMGFCNRELNQQLLEKHGQDVEATIQALLTATDSDWIEKRH
ncbi:next to BRCA1 gene 1 protein-like [Ylistrum balloti]|uniref:next to BRCA1 gene 1 protein-like n=1 Tax=Ylistrum balloti TaxID=509963 RepID=UPI002905A24D|nr:next to BRCA1 gene 1 protein-like [Ylistrum balloti]